MGSQSMLLILASMLLLSSYRRVSARMPLIQINHGNEATDDMLKETPEEVHLEDFFWTGSGDGPPDYLKNVHTGISRGRDVIVKTETVVATVYVDGNNEVDIPICLDCMPDDGGGGGGGGIWDYSPATPPLNYSATDRRYWLLTVMSGFYSLKELPELEQKLARLYRLAFTRHQAKHLGLNEGQQIAAVSLSTGRDRREPKPPMNLTALEQPEFELVHEVREGVEVNGQEAEKPPSSKHSEWLSSSEESDEINEELLHILSTTLDPINDTLESDAYVTIIPWELIQQGGQLEKQLSAESVMGKLPAQLRTTAILLKPDSVRVVVHNITHLSETELAKSTNLYEEGLNDKIDERPIANQTELIYSVFVNEKPVLAVAAANDMKLVSEAEVAQAIGQQVYMKAEPYLREPQATPLAPATRSGSVGFIDSIHNNPALIVVSSIALLLLLLLVLALLLVGRSKARERKLETARTSSRNELLSEMQSSRTTPGGTSETGRSAAASRSVGVQNFSFESESTHGRRVARINYPPPPREEHRNDSLSSSDNTSDSSVYCPINPPPADVQRMLDEKAASLFDRSAKRRNHQYDRPEGRRDPVYTSVISERKREQREKREKHEKRSKARRRYLLENRVGSLETSPRQRHNHSSDEIVTDADTHEHNQGLRRNYKNFERSEAYNPHNHYHRNKLLHQDSIFVDKQYADVHDAQHTPEAINKEIIKALQPSERSSDTASIGSFLSMASVRAFPKTPLPEPLNRVLDPVFVTYYDNADDSQPAAQTANLQEVNEQATCSVASLDGFPMPKAPPQAHMHAHAHAHAQSDNPDPGVLGPIVWERHRRRSGEETETDTLRLGSLALDYSPVRDPAVLRNHYEGLLEGAMQMYQDDLPMPLPTRDFTNKRRRLTNRGSSADTLSHATKMKNGQARPATAQPEKTSKSNHSTQPPSPTSSAWGGSLHGSSSALIRPLSAGSFLLHREQSYRSSQNLDGLSAAPIIEAIQEELRRYKQDEQSG